MARHPYSSAGRGMGSRSKGNLGQQNKGAKSPFKGESPMETCAPGDGYSNRPKGPSLSGGLQNHSGGGQPADAIDRTSRKDVGRHSGRN